MAENTRQPGTEEEGGVPFYPVHFTKEVIVAYCVFAALLGLIAFFPPELRPKADPLTTPEHIKPEWYFLSNYEFLKLFPAEMPILSRLPVVKDLIGTGRAFSIVLQGLAMLLIVLWPFLDRGPRSRVRRRPYFLAFSLAFLSGLIALALVGRYWEWP